MLLLFFKDFTAKLPPLKKMYFIQYVSYVVHTYTIHAVLKPASHNYVFFPI